MNWWLILVRIIHIGSAMSWFGGAIIGSFFLFPTAQALGPAGQPFMDQLMNRRKMGIFFPIVAALTILSGVALYWRASDGLQLTWITSPSGLAFTVGGLAAILAFVAGLVLVAPSVAAQTAVRNELASGDGVPSDAQRARLERADRLMKMATRFDLPLIILAALMMAVDPCGRSDRGRTVVQREVPPWGACSDGSGTPSGDPLIRRGTIGRLLWRRIRDQPRGPWLRGVAAGIALAAGVIHLAQIGVHVEEGWVFAGYG